jgi:nicotinate-nucleotide adenylyltransferase
VRPIAYGGTFDPIHCGHLACAKGVAETSGFDRVVLIPAARPPLRAGGTGSASAFHRLAMCRLAAATRAELFEVDDLELHRSGPSYTIDTVRQLKARGWDSVCWLIGADQVALLPKWHQVEDLVREARVLVMARPGWLFDWQSLPPALRSLRESVVSAPLVDISASEIRRRVAAGEPIDGLTTPAVVEYIRKNKLYGSARRPDASGEGLA